MPSSTHEMKKMKAKRKRLFSGPKQKKRKCEQEALSLSDKENCLKKFLGPEVTLSKIMRLCGIQTGGEGTSQQTLDGKVASARSARHPAAELYRRLAVYVLGIPVGYTSWVTHICLGFLTGICLG